MNYELPKVYDDIRSYRLFDKEDNLYLIGSISNDRYIIAKKEERDAYLDLLKDINGEHSIDELSNIWIKSREDTIKLIDKFYKKGLLQGDNETKENSEVNRLSLNLFSISCNIINKLPVKLINILICVIIILTITSLLLSVIIIGNKLMSGMNVFEYESKYLNGIILSFIIMIPSFMFHELCHALVALKYGLKPSEINIALYLGLFPLFYVRIKGLYTIERINRIKVLLAGFLGNLFILGLSLMSYLIIGKEILIPICIAQLNIIIVNCNPFNLSDGYFISSQILKCINIRSKFFYLLANDVKGLIKGDKKVFIYTIVSFIGVTITAKYFAQYLVLIINQSIGIIPHVNLIANAVVLLMMMGYLIIIRIRWGKGNEA